MQATTIVIDGCGIGVDELDLPQFVDGVPTGQTIKVKQLTFVVQDGPSVLQIHVRFLPENFDKFVDDIRRTRIVPATPADLAKLNGKTA